MGIDGLFDLEFRLRELSDGGDPLERLSRCVPWSEFRPVLQTLRDKERKSPAGRPPFDVLLMFKILVLQSLYNLGDDAMEYQIRDRLSFMRFLGLSLADRVPDAKTIWLFREMLKQGSLVEILFQRFDTYLRANGFAARKGQIIDASIVEIPRQRNSREENEAIKNGEGASPDWSKNKTRQKDVEARWTQKNNKNYYGYKNHISTDAQHKFIRAYATTHAAVHDSQVFFELIDPNNTNASVWADSAYRTPENLQGLADEGLRDRIQRKATRNHPLSEREKQGNHTRSKTRSRIEHIFGVMAQKATNRILRCIGFARARTKIGLRNLAYNIDRYSYLTARAS